MEYVFEILFPKSNGGASGGGKFNSERNAGVRTILARLHCLRYHVLGLRFEVCKIRVFLLLC